MTTEQVANTPKKKSAKKPAKKAEPKKDVAPVGARAVPLKRDSRKGFQPTQGSPEEAKELVKKYAEKRKLTTEQAHDYLIYVGYNRRMALERQDRES